MNIFLVKKKGGILIITTTITTTTTTKGRERIKILFNPFYLKEALDKCNIISQLFSKKLGFLYHRSVGMGNDCMLSLPSRLTYF